MFTFLKMKKKEYEIKLALYTKVKAIMDSQKEFTKFVVKLFTSLKDVPANQFKEELVTKIAELAHGQVNKDRM